MCRWFSYYSLLFTQLVRSKILTNACIWGHKDYRRIDSLQTQAMRFFLGVGNSCPTIGETGWVPIKAYIRERVLKFWKRLSNMEPHHLIHKVFLWSKPLWMGFQQLHPKANQWGRGNRRNWGPRVYAVGDSGCSRVSGLVGWPLQTTHRLRKWR